jgi:DNA polymerase-1
VSQATAPSPTSTRPTLYLIDGYGQFFRAYHAIRTPMTSPVTREPTNLTFGFVGMLLKLLRGEGRMNGPPTYVAVALDVSGDRETFRSALYPAYKANRPPPPDDLPVQVERCLGLLQEIGVPVVGAEGFEADDTMATLARRLAREHPEVLVRIVSKDKDLKQLLAPGVEMYDVHTDELITAESLRAETGLRPDQVIDMLALMGDSVDNVPGVPGIGPKTAVELIREYGSLEGVLAAADLIKGKRGEKIREAASLLPLSKRLVTLRDDAPVSLDLSRSRADALHLEKLLPILRELGFNRYQDEVRALLHRGRPVALTPPTTPANPEPTGARTTGSRSDPEPRHDAGGLFDQPGLFRHEDRAAGTLVSSRPANADYRTVRTTAELEALLRELREAPVFALDTETTGLSPLRCQLCGLSFSTRAGTGWYVPVRSPEPDTHLDTPTVLSVLRPILEDPARSKCGHNLKFDLLVLRQAGVRLAGFRRPPEVPAPAGSDVSPPTVFDTMVASYLIDASRSSHGLDALALSLLGHTNIPISELIGSGASQRTFDTVPLELATQYAAEDADISLRLMEVMHPQLASMALMPLFREVEMPLVEVLAELEYNGILVNPDELDRQHARLSALARSIRERIDEEAVKALGRTFNPDSPKQLAAALFNKPDAAEPGLGLKPVKRTKTGYSTDVEVLESLAEDPGVSTNIPRLIVEYRQLTKLVGTYLVALKQEINPATGRIHASFNQTVAATGRLSSSDPNLQNIPIRTEIGREIRRAFIAPPGSVLISADYSQIELRLLAHLSRDPALTAAFHEDRDIHAAVAAQIHGVPVDRVTREQRNAAKMVNFGIVYGITPYGLARRLGIETDRAAEIIDGYKRRFAGITTFLQECIDHARRHGWVETMLKRRRPIPDIDSNQPTRRALAERTAINSVVQGSAADLIKLAMVRLFADIAEGVPALRGVKMLLQIHDELVIECPADQAAEARAALVSRMEGAMSLSVPIRVDSTIAQTWYDGK